ncbi:hypothetical protein EYC80_007306 [Monilinia laxa]|uniref:Uncharacterized protein n=1 Tax=Monilinia laxa TaxID=61186 RepID=A0A5N6JU97_MONLA|nr:hypothetical protein EYC80_007306 [Monilinia laxa]
MWINFESSHPFAVKVCVGGVNALSGEREVESLAKNLRRQTKFIKGKSIQDYVVTGFRGQRWLDGIAKLDGKVMQFVATSAGDGYSVEAQITGADLVCEIHVEIIPSVIKKRVGLKVQALLKPLCSGNGPYLPPSAPTAAKPEMAITPDSLIRQVIIKDSNFKIP